MKTYIGIPLLAMSLAVVCNLALAASGWTRTSMIVPTGWEWVDGIVGFAWIFLFACMGVSASLLFRSGTPSGKFHACWVLSLLGVCLLYPLYTFGMKAGPGLVGNIVVLLLTIAVIVLVLKSSLKAAFLLIPTALWLAVASVYLVKLLAANRPTG
jgi:tryptophan-rich sensory protein